MPAAIVFSDGATLLVDASPEEVGELLGSPDVTPSGFHRFARGDGTLLVNRERVAYVRPLAYHEVVPGSSQR
jgi:hypothetical protein